MLSPLSLHARQLDSVSCKFMCLPWPGTVDYVIYAMRWDWSPVRTIFIKTLHFHNQLAWPQLHHGQLGVRDNISVDKSYQEL